MGTEYKLLCFQTVCGTETNLKWIVKPLLLGVEYELQSFKCLKFSFKQQKGG